MAVISEAAKSILEKRGLKEADVLSVVNECGDDKIFNKEKGIYIARKEIGELTVYAVFDESGTVQTAYSHKMKILDIVLEGEEDSGWVYCKNGATVKSGHTNLTYLGATRSGPSLTEPISGQSWFEEYLATGALTTAEGLFQQKRA
ncbi:MAG: hypothetical protein MJY64_02095 [archaeon]|nr:hypothetical protein [archaeon]